MQGLTARDGVENGVVQITNQVHSRAVEEQGTVAHHRGEQPRERQRVAAMLGPFPREVALSAISVLWYAEEMSAVPPYWLRSSSWRPSRCRFSNRPLRLRRLRFTWLPSQAALADATERHSRRPGGGRMYSSPSRGTARVVRAATPTASRGFGLEPLRGKGPLRKGVGSRRRAQRGRSVPRHDRQQGERGT